MYFDNKIAVQQVHNSCCERISFGARTAVTGGDNMTARAIYENLKSEPALRTQ